MAQQAINFDPATGDDTTGALRKADNNIKDHEQRIVAVVDSAGKAMTAANSANTNANGRAGLFRSNSYDWFNDVANITVASIAGASDPDRYKAPADYTTIVQLPGYSDKNGLALATTFSAAQRFFLRGKYDGTSGATNPYQYWRPWVELWHTGNTTVDGNNFIKRI